MFCCSYWFSDLFKTKNAICVVTESKLSYRECGICGICVAVLSALKTSSHHTNWEICDFFSFHLPLKKYRFHWKVSQAANVNDLSYTEEMQYAQLKKVYICITWTTKTHNILKYGILFQSLRDKEICCVFKSYMNIWI